MCKTRLANQLIHTLARVSNAALIQGVDTIRCTALRNEVTTNLSARRCFGSRSKAIQKGGYPLSLRVLIETAMAQWQFPPTAQMIDDVVAHQVEDHISRQTSHHPGPPHFTRPSARLKQVCPQDGTKVREALPYRTAGVRLLCRSTLRRPWLSCRFLRRQSGSTFQPHNNVWINSFASRVTTRGLHS